MRRVGRLSFSGRLITVTVHPDRLTLKAFIMGEYTIHGAEILSVTDDDSRWRRHVVIEHSAPGQASPVLLASLADDLRWAISQIRRDPVAASAEPLTPDSSADKVARNMVWTFTSIMYIAGVVMGIGLAGIGVTMLVRAPKLFSVVFVVVGLLSAYQCTRELVKHARQD